MNRHLSRMILMQSLYEWDMRPKEDVDAIIQRNIRQYESEVDLVFIDATKAGILSHLKEIDDLLIKAAPEWPIEQVAIIDKTILRIAIYEMLFGEDVPAKVAINEAVELGKAFGGDNSSKFINGVLGTLYRQSNRYDPTQDNLHEEQQDDQRPDSNAA